ncbi:hypothetical protein LguiA_026796 [Lonicera macranthoides]
MGEENEWEAQRLENFSIKKAELEAIFFCLVSKKSCQNLYPNCEEDDEDEDEQ